MLASIHCVVLTACVFAADPAAPQLPPGFAVEPVVIKVSKETTFFDSPLQKDGTVDYIAALDQMLGKGVTRDTNAVVPLWQATGSGWTYDSPEHMARARRLGLEIDPKAHCLTGLTEMMAIANHTEAASDAPPRDLPSHWRAVAKLLSDEDRAVLKRTAQQLHELNEQSYEVLARATGAPWAAKDHPELAIWLRINAGPLRLVEEASKRPHYYWPQEGGPDNTMIGMLLPSLGSVRQASRIVCSRAMLRIHEGDLEGAWQDFLIVSRLARLVAQEPILISQLVARSIDAVCEPVLLALLDSNKLSAEKLKAMAKQFDALGHTCNYERAINLVERCSLLDTVGMMRRRGMRTVDAIGGEDKPLTDALIARNVRATDFVIDSNLVLKSLNAWMDDLVAAYRKPTCLERLKASEAVVERLEKLAENRGKSTIAIVAAGLLLPAEQRRKLTSEKISDMLVSIMMPAAMTVIKAKEDGEMRRELLQVAFALAVYRSEKKAHPQTLAQLVPDHMAKLPADRFDEKPLKYQRTPDGDGYVLYSIGSDLMDNEGSAEHDIHRRVDLVVSLPVKVKQE